MDNSINRWFSDETMTVCDWLRGDAKRWRSWTVQAEWASREAEKHTGLRVAERPSIVKEKASSLLAKQLQHAYWKEGWRRRRTIEDALLYDAACRVSWRQVAGELLRDRARNRRGRRGLRFVVVTTARFPLGEVVVTTAAADALGETEIAEAIQRHARGDWGLVDADVWSENDRGLTAECQLRSAYAGRNGLRFEVLTQSDRSWTTVFLPESQETATSAERHVVLESGAISVRPQRGNRAASNSAISLLPGAADDMPRKVACIGLGGRGSPETRTAPTDDTAKKTGIQPNDPQTFGGCPRCGQNNGYLNIGRDHWFICHTHRTKWWFGSNLFSDWREQDPVEWEGNDERIGPYESVEPRFLVEIEPAEAEPVCEEN